MGRPTTGSSTAASPPAARLCGTTTGACVQGTETCSGAGAWGACLDGNGTPVVLPGTLAEACNAIDDDCDGVTDEGLDLGACSAGTGACAASGVRVCSPEGTIVCSAVAGDPSPESCNGIDDDCDGTTDEELQAALCPLQSGVCAGSTTICDGGEWLACGQESYGPAWEETETMCDGQDNDCDGTTDEGLRFTAYRDADFDGFGSSSAQVCFVFAGWSRTGGDCNDADASVHPGAPEVCGNLRDDDCDTFVDEAC